MKRIFQLFILISVLLAPACTDNDIYSSLPEKISEFISEYYPNPKIAYYDDIKGQYTVIVSEGPKFVFDSTFSWTLINGNGMPLPQNLIFDQLPEKLYAYLQQTQSAASVFGVQRNEKTYTCAMMDYTIKYDVATGNITETTGNQ